MNCNDLSSRSKVKYYRRKPEDSLLYKVVSKNMNSVFRELESKNKFIPSYIKSEFESFLDCGILAKGFLRLKCTDCTNEKLVAFSCKKRGICSSCGTRRMYDISNHLVDNVFPYVNVRQWVLSFPFNLRYLFSYNKKALSKAINITTNEINHYYNNKFSELDKSRYKLYTGGITSIQRFGGSLNLNTHFHILYADGVWDEEGKFYFADPPGNEEVENLNLNIKTKITKSLTKMGLLDSLSLNQINNEDQLELEFPGMAECIASSIKRVDDKGQKLEKVGQSIDTYWRPPSGDMLTSYIDGFSLNAKIRINASNRSGLEHLCRYINRPPISID